jgi:hypothetical protein
MTARSAVIRLGSAKMCTMKRSQRWSVDREEGPGHRRSQAGPFRRHRALRQLDSLAQHPARELSEAVGVAHVRVIDDADGRPSPLQDGAPPAPVALSLHAAALRDERSDSAEHDGERAWNASDRFHAVPIDEEFGVSLLPATQQR